MITGDYQDLSQQESHAVSIQIDNVEPIPQKSFQSVLKQIKGSGLGYNVHVNPAWFNYHLKVFRARSTTATLTISDWASDTEPGGPIGQEIIYNFIEVMPYLED